MGPQAVLDEAVQCIMPFDRDAMEESVGQEALGDHLFDHVPSRRRQGKTGGGGAADANKKPSAAQAVERAESVHEAEVIVKQSLLDKFAALIGYDVPDNEPVAALGLDSLISIELKNWIKHIFQTPLQTSELSGAPSIISLSKLIVSRMDLKCQTKSEAAGNEEGEKQTNGTANGHEEATSTHGHNCCRFSRELPVQPLPDLDDSLDLWLEANEHLYTPEQLVPIHQDIEAMRALASQRTEPFDLAHPPLMRFALVRSRGTTTSLHLDAPSPVE